MKPTFFSRYALTILVVATFVMPFAFTGARRALLTNRNEVQDWLPEEYTETQTFQWFQRHFSGEHFLLVSWEGCTLDDQRLPLFVHKLEKLTTADVPMKNGRLPIFDWLIRTSSGLTGWEDPTATAAPPEPKPLFTGILTGASVLERLQQPPMNLSRDEALARLRGLLIGPTNKRSVGTHIGLTLARGRSPQLQDEPILTCAVATLSDAGRANLRGTVEKAYSVAIDECNVPATAIHAGGPPRDNVAIDQSGESALYRLAAFAFLVGAVISWWCLRSPRLILMVISMGGIAGAISLAAVWFTGGEINAILLTMPPLVYVAAISGSIHLSNYYRDTLEEHGPEGAPERAVKHAMLPLCLATSTTAIGLFSLCHFNLGQYEWFGRSVELKWGCELVPIQSFGFYSALGVVLTLFLFFLILPSCFQLFPLKPRAQSTTVEAPGLWDPLTSPIWWRAARWIVDRYVLVAAGCILLLAVVGSGVMQMKTSVSLMRLFAADSPVLHDYRWLEQNLGELVPMEVVVQVDPTRCRMNMLEKMELIERIQHELEEIPAVGNCLSAVTFAPHLPKKEEYRPRAGVAGAFTRLMGVRDEYATARKITNDRLEAHRSSILAEDYLAEDATTDNELWRISARVAALQEIDYGAFQADIRAAVEKAVGGPEEQEAAGFQVVYTGLVPLVYKAQRSLLESLVSGFALDVVIVTLAMIVFVREWSAGVLLMLPAIFPVFIVFGMMGWMGVIVDVGTVMAPAVALGVTVDDVVHFMLTFRGGLKEGLNRREAVMVAYKGCARAMYQSWGVIGLGLSTFALSQFGPTRIFGIMMVTLLTASLFGNLVLLPALLVSPLGSLFGRKFQKQNRQAESGPRIIPEPRLVNPPRAAASTGGPNRATWTHVGGRKVIVDGPGVE